MRKKFTLEDHIARMDEIRARVRTPVNTRAENPLIAGLKQAIAKRTKIPKV